MQGCARSWVGGKSLKSPTSSFVLKRREKVNKIEQVTFPKKSQKVNQDGRFQVPVEWRSIVQDLSRSKRRKTRAAGKSFVKFST